MCPRYIPDELEHVVSEGVVELPGLRLRRVPLELVLEHRDVESLGEPPLILLVAEDGAGDCGAEGKVLGRLLDRDIGSGDWITFSIYSLDRHRAFSFLPIKINLYVFLNELEGLTN